MQLLYLRTYSVGIDVARDDQREICWPVVAGEEVDHVCTGGAFKIVDRSNNGTVVRMPFGEESAGRCLVCAPAWFVEDRLAHFVEHDVALNIDLGLADRCAEVGEPICFEPQQCAERVSRCSLVVHRLVDISPRVVASADGFHRNVEIGSRRGSREHQMLEQMGEPASPGRFVG